MEPSAEKTAPRTRSELGRVRPERSRGPLSLRPLAVPAITRICPAELRDVDSGGIAIGAGVAVSVSDVDCDRVGECGRISRRDRDGISADGSILAGVAYLLGVPVVGRQRLTHVVTRGGRIIVEHLVDGDGYVGVVVDDDAEGYFGTDSRALRVLEVGVWIGAIGALPYLDRERPRLWRRRGGGLQRR